MDVPRLGAPFAALAAALVCVMLPGPASATSTLEVGDAAVIRVQFQKGAADLLVQTWDRNAVQVETADESGVELNRGRVDFGTEKNPLVPTIPGPTAQQLGEELVAPGGPIPPQLGPEEFPLANFKAGPHDVVFIRATGGQHVTITVPASTGALNIGGFGQIDIVGYRGANLFVRSGGGRTRIENASTTAYLEMFRRGAILVADSTFARLRARSGLANLLFVHCRTRQVEVNSVAGSIVYDDGSFEPGLSRFDTDRGSIALGVAGNAQVAAHAADGHLQSVFERKTASEQRNGEAITVVGGGGPLVTLNAPRGGILLYDGTLSTRRDVPEEWRPLHRVFQAARNQRAGAAAPGAGMRREEAPAIRRLVEPRAGTFGASRRRV